MVKLPQPHSVASSRSNKTFEHEVLHLARLRHTGLPRVHQFDATQETAYAILEPQLGQSLTELTAGTLLETEALEVALQLATSVASLHAIGFVHGDLSCAHVLWSRSRRRIGVVDTGALHRPIPFDATPDLQGLGLIVRQLASKTVTRGHSTELTRIAEAWSDSQHPPAHPLPVSQLVADLARRYAALTNDRNALSERTTPTWAPRAKHVRSELAQLRRYWDRATGADGRVLMIVGPAGSGKTRLLDGFRDYVQSQAASAWAIECSDSDRAPFSAIKRLLDKHLQELAKLDPAPRARAELLLREAAGPMASQLRLLSPRLAALFGNAHSVRREGDAQEIFIAGLADFLAKYFENSARCALIIDDVHWLDASSRMVLSRLAARLCPQGHMLVCGARDDEDLQETIDRFDAVLPAGLLERMQLKPLTEGDARDVVAEFLGEAHISQETVVEPLSRLSDGTPLSLLELLELAVEHRLLRPHHGAWQLDSAPLHQMRLPASSRALIERRLALLDPVTITVLRSAAIIRGRVDPQILTKVTDTSDTHVRIALDRAASARLLFRTSDSRYRFVHDCVWEALLQPVPPQEQRELHQRVADALWNTRGAVSEHDYELARYLAGGIIERNPRRTYEALRHAGKRAIAAYDDTLALSFLKPAERAAGLAEIDASRDFYVDLAETSLRIGATGDSLLYFEQALQRSRPGFESAHVRGRLAWVHHCESRVQECWTTLEAALREYNRGVPSNGPWSIVNAATDSVILPVTLGTAILRQADLVTLCGLYVLCLRVSFESGQPLCALACSAHLAAATTQLHPCRGLVEAELYTAFGLSAVSGRAPWRKHLERAHTLARQLEDPIAQTLCHQLHHVIAGWLGDADESQRQALLCVEERGHFMELGELCHLSFGMYAQQIVLGRPEAGLTWLERAITTVQQGTRAPALFVLIEEAACVTLSSLGRENEIAELRRRLARVQRAEIQPGSYFYFLSFQHRMQQIIDVGDLGEPFEALVREWQAPGTQAKQAHILAAAYYVHVAHARVHLCLRAQPADRAALLAKLDVALADVDAFKNKPLFAAHSHVMHAARHWFRGSPARAERLLNKAEGLAREIGCVWVSYAAARLRAHMLKTRGKLLSARDEARVAAQIARTHGPRSRLREICEEFELSEFLVDPAGGETDTPNTRRHLDALLHIAQASSRDLGPRRQARFIVDELLETLAAERGFLFMRDANSGALLCHAARRSGGQDLLVPQASYDNALVEQVYATGQTLLAGGREPGPDTAGTPESACIVVALVLREQAVGVLYLDRDAVAGSFRSEDVALLEALANQVPVALELAGALRERERLEQNLRQAQKMEAIGRLAGGIAHDFNNILATIEFAAGCLANRINPEGEEDLFEVRDAARRGADLTRQLLMFSRGKSVPPRRIDLVDVMQRLAPMLCRMVRADVHIDMILAEQPLYAMADPSQIERLLMNLCRNASDAMPAHGGRITIRLKHSEHPPDEVSHGSSAPPRASYAELSVADTGTGMNEEVRARLFEPFFTTKSSQQGTGLGLAIVYTIVQQYGGHIEVASEPGAGATFRIHLPLSTDIPTLERLPIPNLPGLSSSVPPHSPGRTTIIVVDDDDVLRRQSARSLEAAGFETLVARDGEDALRVIADARNMPVLAVTDVQMPGMDGVQLAARLRANHPDIKVVFVSGEGPDVLIASGSLTDNAVFLQKPFKPEALRREVETLLLGEREPAHGDLSGVRKLSGMFEPDEADQPL